METSHSLLKSFTHNCYSAILQMSAILYTFGLSLIFPAFRQACQIKSIESINIITEIQFNSFTKLDAKILDRKLSRDKSLIFACMKSHYCERIESMCKRMHQNTTEKFQAALTDKNVYLMRSHSRVKWFENGLKETLNEIEKMRPYVRNKSFENMILWVITLVGTVSVIFLFIAASAALFYVFDVQISL